MTRRIKKYNTRKKKSHKRVKRGGKAHIFSDWTLSEDMIRCLGRFHIYDKKTLHDKLKMYENTDCAAILRKITDDELLQMRMYSGFKVKEKERYIHHINQHKPSQSSRKIMTPAPTPIHTPFHLPTPISTPTSTSTPLSSFSSNFSSTNTQNSQDSYGQPKNHNIPQPSVYNLGQQQQYQPHYQPQRQQQQQHPQQHQQHQQAAEALARQQQQQHQREAYLQQQQQQQQRRDMDFEQWLQKLRQRQQQEALAAQQQQAAQQAEEAEEAERQRQRQAAQLRQPEYAANVWRNMERKTEFLKLREREQELLREEAELRAQQEELHKRPAGYDDEAARITEAERQQRLQQTQGMAAAAAAQLRQQAEEAERQATQRQQQQEAAQLLRPQIKDTIAPGSIPNGWKYVIGPNGLPHYANNKLNIILYGKKTTEDLEEATRIAERRNQLPLINSRFQTQPKAAEEAVAVVPANIAPSQHLPPDATRTYVVSPDDLTQNRLAHYSIKENLSKIKELQNREKQANKDELQRINKILNNLDRQQHQQQPRLTSNSEEGWEDEDDRIVFKSSAAAAHMPKLRNKGIAGSRKQRLNNRNERFVKHREKAKTRRKIPRDQTSDSDSLHSDASVLELDNTDSAALATKVLNQRPDLVSAQNILIHRDEGADTSSLSSSGSSVNSLVRGMSNLNLNGHGEKAANDSQPHSIPPNGQYNVTIQYNQTPIQHKQQQQPAVLQTEDDKVTITIGNDTVELNIDKLNELVFNLNKSSSMNINCRDMNSPPRQHHTHNFSQSKCIKVISIDGSSPSFAPTSITLPFVISFGSIKECDEFKDKVKHIRDSTVALYESRNDDQPYASDVSSISLSPLNSDASSISFSPLNSDASSISDASLFHSEPNQSSNKLALLSSRSYNSIGGKWSKRKRHTRKTRRNIRKRTRKHKHKRTRKY